MPRKLILHIGPHKTGSTAIQHMLAKLSDELEDTSWHYERFTSVPAGSHGVADSFSNNKKLDIDFSSISEKWEKYNLVISSENFSRLNQTQVYQFLDNFSSLDARVVYYLRNPLDRLPSQWKEMVKHGYRFSFVEYVAGRLLKPFQDSNLNEVNKITPWANYVGLENIDIHVYGGIKNSATHFLETYFPFVSQGAGEELSKVNQSFDAYRTEVVRALMGLQVCVQKDRNLTARIDGLIERVRMHCDSKQARYLKKLNISLDNPILRSIEKSIIDQFGSRISGLHSQTEIHEIRYKTWEYVAPEIWLTEPDLTAQLFDIRREALAKFGEPSIDVRLRNL